MRRTRYLCLGISLSLTAHLSLASAALSRPITHGSDISKADVGPAAAGISPVAQKFSGQIATGKTYAFAQAIPASATYDGFTVAGPHLLIEGARFDVPLDISLSLPIVFRGVEVRVPATSPWTILVRPGAGSVYFLWSEAGGDQTASDRHAPGSAMQLRANGAVIYRSRFSSTADGIDISGGNVQIKASLIEDLLSPPSAHNDAVQLAESAVDVVIEKSKILNSNPQTSCLYLLGQRIKVSQSYLAGGGWTIYGGERNNGHGGGSANGVAITDNVFGQDYFKKSGHFGPLSYWAHAPANIWHNNYYADGRAVTP